MSVLCVHPNFELYGSDRSFANVVEAMVADTRFDGVDVMIPAEGPILTIQPFRDMDVSVRPLWILRRRQLVEQFTLGLPRNISRIFRAMRDIRRFNLTYINTVVVFDFIVAAMLSRRRVVVHVREIPTGVEMILFRSLLIGSRATLIFNSQATRNAFALPQSAKSFVVYNGFADPCQPAPLPGPESGILNLLVIGRINHWKGQETVVSAIAALPPEKRARVRCRIVGGVFEKQIDFLHDLEARIAADNVTANIEICPFESDPAASYQGADLVIVPSRLPEPFGRVAIEAMAHGRAVAATAHGGLTEIVDDEVTGQLFPPGDATALAAILSHYLDDADRLRAHGQAGRKRFLEHFTDAASNDAITNILATLQDGGAGART